ncbi:het domain protein [Colletotrichum camelliae]|nr:het domain protein [Colletotrichum camelliae]
MDYLPYPQNSLLPPITVPYLPRYELYNGDYFSSPERVCQPYGIWGATREDASLLQEWFFFGLLETIGDQPLDRSSFVRRGNINGESCDVIDASPVTALVELLTARLRGQKGSDALWKKILLRLRHAAIVCDRFTGIEQGEESLLAWESGLALSSLLMRRLLANGWCEHQVLSLECHNSYMTTYYLSSLRRNESKGISHHECTASACKAYNTNENYDTKHASEECGCVFQNVDEDTVVKILASNGIPLISMHEDDDGNIKMEVVPFTAELPYTATSHVWKDGLGNNEGNALPHCQVRRLFRELKMQESVPQASFEYLNLGSLFSPFKRTGVVFWMDTLCIPVRSEHAHLRSRAISQMALVYSAAQATLVLDEELRRSEEKCEGREGLLARCLASKWNTRCWTLQEVASQFSQFFYLTKVLAGWEDCCVLF